MFLRQLLFDNFTRKANQEWNRKVIPASLLDQYKELSPQIEDCYKNATHWHGTGRYHYDTDGQSKYDVVNTDELIDVFERILTENGLKVHDDPWVKVNGRYASSISTTEWRMYARIYAELHEANGEHIEITYAKRKQIINYFFYYTLLSTPLFALYKGVVAAFDKTRYATKGQDWVKTINNTVRSKGNAFTDLLKIMGECESTIDNNYGILVGIDGTDIGQAKINPIIGMFETRFTGNITLERITHFEVPLANISTIKDLLKKHKVSKPVFPIELCEIFCSTQPIRFFHNSTKLPTFKLQDLIWHYKNT